jgi:hypothetical protein
MMIVYSALERIDYQGCDLMGVFASREAAEQFIRSYPGFVRQYPGHHYGYVESALGQPIDSYHLMVDVEFADLT